VAPYAGDGIAQNWMNCGKAKLSTMKLNMLIRSQAPDASGEGSETRWGVEIATRNTPTASNNFDINVEADEIVRACVKAQEVGRNDRSARFSESNNMTDNEGGFFVPEEFISQTFSIPDAPGGQLRDHCTVIRVTSKDGYVPTLGGTTFAAIAEEAAFTGAETTPTVGQVAYSTGKYGTLIRVSDELLADSIPNLPNLLSGIFGTAWGRKSQGMITGGNGTSTYQGIVNGTDGAGASTTFYTMANATSIVAADIIGAYFDVPAQYRGVDTFAWVFTSELGGLINGIGTAAAGVHAVESLTNAPDQFLMGRPVVYSDVSGSGLGTSITSTEKCGIAGDFSAYMLFERTGGISVRRNDSLYMGNHIAPRGCEVTMNNWVNCGKAKATAMPIRSEASHACEERSETRRGVEIATRNTPSAPGNFDIHAEVDEIVRAASKDVDSGTSVLPRMDRSDSSLQPVEMDAWQHKMRSESCELLSR